MTTKNKPADVAVTLLLGQQLQITLNKSVLASQSAIFRFMLEPPFFDSDLPTVELSDADPHQLLYFFQILKNNCECRINEKNVAFLTELAERFDVEWLKDDTELFNKGYTSLNVSPEILTSCDADTLKKLERSRRRTTMMKSREHQSVVRFTRDCSM